MEKEFNPERRDPTSFVLSLGRVLSRARTSGQSGRVDVRGKVRNHVIFVRNGAVIGIDELGRENRIAALDFKKHIEYIFSMPRPHVIWHPGEEAKSSSLRVDPNVVVVSGVTVRKDLFSPRPLLDRIPVETLKIVPDVIRHIRTLPISAEELNWAEQLTVPTPIPMILWKRGLRPNHAGALLVALNLMGCFAGHWDVGDFPRSSLANKIRRKLKAGARDYELLGVQKDVSLRDLDRAFRRISYELHPDRVTAVSKDDALRAARAFSGVSEAYDRIRRSRRARPVRQERVGIGRIHLEKQSVPAWRQFLEEAMIAGTRGDQRRAQAFALKAFAANPPESAKREILGILSRAA